MFIALILLQLLTKRFAAIPKPFLVYKEYLFLAVGVRAFDGGGVEDCLSGKCPLHLDLYEVEKAFLMVLETALTDRYQILRQLAYSASLLQLLLSVEEYYSGLKSLG